MSGLSLDQNSMHDNETTVTELTCIRGIGATKKQWLAALDIDSVETLAQVSVDELKQQLKELGYTVSRNEIEGWMKQAQTFVTVSSQVTSAKTALPEIESSWSAIAAFQVEVQSHLSNGAVVHQVRIQNLDNGQSEVWVELQDNELQQWILTQLMHQSHSSVHEVPIASLDAPASTDSSSLENSATENSVTENSAIENSATVQDVSSDARAAAFTPAPTPTPAPAIAITQVRIHQPRWTQTPLVVHASEPMVTGTLMTDFPLELELCVERLDHAAPTPLTYQTTCQARHLASGAVLDLGAARITLHPDQATYAIALPQTALHEPGAYRLTVAAALESHPATITYFKIPVLHLQSSTPMDYGVHSFQISCGI
ncbi:MAG: hypothetical protein NW220_06120 [Leptolyngbyaceae cyanobacterium bins.349]|nr:hypothetical protein [Leptolyngbyaceae cyanobacterium bins.349]